MREWRKTHELSDEEKRRSNCRAYTRMLIKRGHLTPQPCMWCLGEAETFHLDYGRPRVVAWMCAPCRRWFLAWVGALPEPSE